MRTWPHSKIIFLDSIFHFESIEVTSRLVSMKLLGVNDHFSSPVPDFWYIRFLIKNVTTFFFQNTYCQEYFQVKLSDLLSDVTCTGNDHVLLPAMLWRHQIGPNGATMVAQTPSTYQNLWNLILFKKELVAPTILSLRSAVTNDLVTNGRIHQILGENREFDPRTPRIGL